MLRPRPDADAVAPGRTRAVARAVAAPLPVALLVAVVVAAVTVPWAVAALLPLWALAVVAATGELGPRVPSALPPSRRSLAEVTPALAPRVRRALDAERGVLAELDALPGEPEGLRAEVTRLGDELVAVARRASAVDAYLAGVDVDELRRREEAARVELGRDSLAEALAEQRHVVEELRDRRRGLELELEHVEVALGAVRGRLVQARTGARTAGGLVDEVGLLRGRVRAVADGYAEAYGQNGAH